MLIAISIAQSLAVMVVPGHEDMWKQWLINCSEEMERN